MKKQDREVLTILVIIVLVIVSMAVLLGVLPKSNEPHFKIMKEECWNETTEYFTREYYQGNYTLDYVFELIKKNKHFNRPIIIFKEEGDYFLEYTLIKEVCEQVEVDEITWGKSCNYDEQGNVLGCGGAYMPKQDLSIEWLDENCECVEAYYKEEGQESVCIKEFSGRCSEDYYKCSKYKIGNYTIETWSQIK